MPLIIGLAFYGGVLIGALVQWSWAHQHKSKPHELVFKGTTYIDPQFTLNSRDKQICRQCYGPLMAQAKKGWWAMECPYCGVMWAQLDEPSI